MLKQLWSRLRRPATATSAGSLLLVGVIAGVIGWGGFNTALEVTNTTEFCISCHEMSQLVYPEYKASAHYSNASGVRAGCPDCHVPRAWGPKVVRKIKASTELYHAMLGTIDTPEKFEAHRLEMAERVWAEMTANNARECRNCHSYDAMAFHLQSQRGREKMEESKLRNTPCIECHKGVAHKRPAIPRDD